MVMRVPGNSICSSSWGMAGIALDLASVATVTGHTPGRREGGGWSAKWASTAAVT
jgi:hypothetical protein